jgi:hypothetical protein
MFFFGFVLEIEVNKIREVAKKTKVKITTWLALILFNSII